MSTRRLQRSRKFVRCVKVKLIFVIVTVTAELVVRLLQSARMYITYGSKYAVQKRKDFRWQLNVAVDDHTSLSSVGRRFHAQGAATENAPIRHMVLGWKRWPLLEAHSEERDGMMVTSMSRLVI